jgi:alginate O-acetyltransferase complex protein AlgI
MNARKLLDAALWAAGAGHFLVLVASVQVPRRLGWKEDLARLTPFNRKLMWTYGAFTVLTIVAFGVLTLLCHDAFVAGDRTARALAAFIANFWTARIGVDLFYFRHAEWPHGPGFAVGHALLTFLFAALAWTYWAAVFTGGAL